jgi:hypothetical protein
MPTPSPATLVAALALFAAPIAPAAGANPPAPKTYFVRTTGSDAANGTTPATAFRTLDKAAKTARAGDTIHVGAGTYNEELSPRNKGTAAKPIRYLADSNGTLTGDVGPVVVRAPNGKHALVIDGDDHHALTGFTFRGANGKAAVRWRAAVGGTLSACTIIGADREGIRVEGATLAVAGCAVSGTGRDGIRADRAGSRQTRLTLSAVTFTNIGDDGVEARRNTVVVAEDCAFTSVTGAAVELTGATPNLTLRRARVSSARFGVLLVQPATATIVNSTFSNIATDGLVIPNGGATRAAVVNCTFFACGGSAVRIRSGALTLTNTILAGSSTGLAVTGGTLTRTTNLFSGNGNNFSGTTLAPGELTGDPAFTAPPGDLTLTSTSAAIDTGTPATPFTTTDIAGNARPAGAAWDIGASEHNASFTRPKITRWFEANPQ